MTSPSPASVEPISAADREKDDTTSISPSDPRVVLAGIRHFGLAHDRADLQDLEYAFERLSARVVELEADALAWKTACEEETERAEQLSNEFTRLAHEVVPLRAKSVELEAALVAEKKRADDLNTALEQEETDCEEMAARLDAAAARATALLEVLTTAHVAMTLARALPCVEDEYDFGPAIDATSAAILRHGASYDV